MATPASIAPVVEPIASVRKPADEKIIPLLYSIFNGGAALCARIDCDWPVVLVTAPPQPNSPPPCAPPMVAPVVLMSCVPPW